MGEFIYSGKNNPCPLCNRTKDQDCRWNAQVILCHTYCDADAGVSGYVYRGKESIWGIYFPQAASKSGRTVFTKPNRPKQSRDFVYYGTEGNPIVKVTRKDNGNGNKKIFQSHWNGSDWVKGQVNKVQAQIRLYRISEPLNQQALSQHSLLLIVEGEPLVDKLLKLNIAATTAIGGAGKWRKYGYPNYLDDLSNIHQQALVICPDRDTPGIEHGLDIAQDFPQAAWLYANPTDTAWQSPELGGGYDLGDWIAEMEKAGFDNTQIADAINKAVEPKPRQFDQTNSNFMEVDSDTQECLAEEVSTLVGFSQNVPALEGLLVPALANSFDNLARKLNVSPIVFLGVLLSVAASLLKVNTRIEIDATTDFYPPGILWIGLVAESGSAKSPIFDTVLKPLERLQVEADKRYDAKKNAYEEELAEWEKASKENREAKPKPPTRHEFYFQDCTIEALADSLAIQPDQGVIQAVDELAGFINGLNQYKPNGRGSDRQKWLSAYDGRGIKVNRKGSERVAIPRTAISLTGTIQPSTLRRVMGDLEEVDGLWARFAWIRLPLTVMPPPGEGSNFDLGELLYSLYCSLANLAATTYRLDRKGRSRWSEWHIWTEKEKINEPHPALRAIYPKARERAARIALVIHCLNWAFKKEDPPEVIPSSTVAAAITLAQWMVGQARIIYSEAGLADNPESTKILSFVERFKGQGWVSARQTARWYPSKSKPKAPECRKFMEQVVRLGYAIDNGKSTNSREYKVQISPSLNSRDIRDKTGQHYVLQGLEGRDKSCDTVVTNRDISNNEEPNFSVLSNHVPITGTKCHDKVTKNGTAPKSFQDKELNSLVTNGTNTNNFKNPIELENEPNLKSDVNRWNMGDRVEVHHEINWELATIIKLPNNHPDPTKRSSFWKVRLDTGSEKWIWEMNDIRPISSSQLN